MIVAGSELLMLGASATSAACCLASPARSCRRTWALAVIMFGLMCATVIDQSVQLQYLLSALTVLFAVSLLIGQSSKVERSVEEAWQRSLGALLMVVIVLVQLRQTPAAMEGQQEMHAYTAAAGRPALAVVQVGAVVYAAWTTTVVFLRHRSMTTLSRVEHIAMAVTLLAMGFLMT